MSEHRRRIDEVLGPSYLADLREWPLDELRRRHAECLELETEVSYVRRMTQARIDILEAELDRRARGGSVGELISALPEILADEGPRAPVEKSRLTRRLAPSMDIQWRRGREHLITDDTLATLPNVEDDELRSTMRELGALEQEVSQQRRRLHLVIDRMDAELAARHKVGQA
ncbi:MAG TPA: aerial mycelium formation protein [Acidimicrobiia bacterium]|nr:aerial mycelium formation protein [Acidimicrobiia bacterium]